MNNAVTAAAAGAYVLDGKPIDAKTLAAQGISAAQLDNAYKGTMAYAVLSAHNTLPVTEKGAPLKIKFDAMASHDITYVGIIQNAKASGLEKFPLPYVLTNCHNSLCAVGGTINEDDHVFGLSAAKRYGGIFVPPHQAVIHTYMREEMSGCGRMILGSDSHTRYGALGTMAVGEGGPELVKQLLGRTYDINYPDVVAVILKGKPAKGVGPQDVALSLIGKVFPGGFVKNKVLEFIGEGVKNLPIEYRNGIDVMTTETTCLSSIWTTDDDEVKNYYAVRGRLSDYRAITPEKLAYYDAVVETGNEVLDTILSEKSLNCEHRHIRLSCIVDASHLDFMSTLDIYALLGNALDNAIENVSRYRDEEKRVISLNIKAVGDFLSIQTNNYCEDQPKVRGGLPVSTKRDREYHGFGLKSMRHIAEKYGGSLAVSVEDHVFTLQILLPMPKEFLRLYAMEESGE